jgi:hypothetical protein
MTKELWNCKSCGWKSVEDEEPDFNESPCGCCYDFVCPKCGSGNIENEFIKIDTTSKIEVLIHGKDGKKYTFKFDNLADLIKDNIEELGDTDIYEIRDVLLPNIISTIEH